MNVDTGNTTLAAPGALSVAAAFLLVYCTGMCKRQTAGQWQEERQDSLRLFSPPYSSRTLHTDFQHYQDLQQCLHPDYGISESSVHK